MNKNKEIKWNRISRFKVSKESPGFMLWKVSLAWRKQIELVLGRFDLTHPQFVVLASLAWLTRSGDLINQVELARCTGIDPATLSQIVRGLNKKKLLKRKILNTDERSKFLNLTEQGEKVISKVIPAVEKKDEEFFASLQSQNSFLKGLHELSE